MKIYRMLKQSFKKNWKPLVVIVLLSVGLYVLTIQQRQKPKIANQGKSKPLLDKTFNEHGKQDEPADAQSRMEQRSQHILDHCKVLQTLPNDSYTKHLCVNINPVIEKTYLLSRHRLVVNIPTTTNTVLKRVVLMLLYGGKIPHKNPFRLNDVDISGYLLKSMRVSVGELIKSERNAKVTFVKDPYAELLSIYMDNLYMPNAWAWRTLAKHVLPNDRRSCIHNVTFPEFVDYFVKTKQQDVCSTSIMLSNVQDSDPCDLHYDFVGKYETLEDDLSYILKETALSKYVSLPNFKTESDISVLSQYVSDLFLNMPDVLMDCGVDVKMVVNRLWRRLQGRGILGRYESFPFEDDNVNEMSQSQMQTLIMRNYLSGEKFDREANPNLLLKEAFALLSTETILQLRDIFALDFSLYGYDEYPEYIKEGRLRKKPYRVKFLDLR